MSCKSICTVFAATALLTILIPLAASAQSTSPPGVPPMHDPPSAASLPSAAASPTSLSLVVQEYGQIRLSLDAVGTIADSGTVQVEKPAGAKVRKAYLVTATTGFTGAQLAAGDIQLQGNPIAWSRALANSIGSYNYWADVTSVIKPLVDSAASGTVNLTVSESNTYQVDGSILVVIFDDPSLTTDNTVLLYFGAQDVNGDSFRIEFGAPIDKQDPNLRLDLSLGITYGYQEDPVLDQFSHVDINSQRLTSSAGGQDDGEGTNGALITVGGLGDNPAVPPNPNTGPVTARSDDELYDLRSFAKQNDTSMQIDTLNPSVDDNIMFAALFLGATRSVGLIDLDISLHNNPTTAAEAHAV